MDNRTEQAPTQSPRVDKRRDYSPPTIIEYGSVAKLTRSGGSTQFEGTIPAKKQMCL